MYVRIETEVFLKHMNEADPEYRLNWFYNRILPESTDSFLFFNKPNGLACHGGAKLDGDLVRLLKLCGYSEAAPVHRLDKDTTGLLIIGLNFRAQRMASLWFSEQDQVKKYASILAVA